MENNWKIKNNIDDWMGKLRRISICLRHVQGRRKSIEKLK